MMLPRSRANLSTTAMLYHTKRALPRFRCRSETHQVAIEPVASYPLDAQCCGLCASYRCMAEHKQLEVECLLASALRRWHLQKQS